MAANKDATNSYTKKDWTLFRERIPEWQEAYMEKLVREYIELLSGNELASDKFWALKERIDEDKHKKGVSLMLNKSELKGDLVDLLYDGAITEDDLEGFSDILKEDVERDVKWWRNEYSDTEE